MEIKYFNINKNKRYGIIAVITQNYDEKIDDDLSFKN
jgi:hypothetical protein